MPIRDLDETVERGPLWAEECARVREDLSGLAFAIDAETKERIIKDPIVARLAYGLEYLYELLEKKGVIP